MLAHKWNEVVSAIRAMQSLAESYQAVDHDQAIPDRQSRSSQCVTISCRYALAAETCGGLLCLGVTEVCLGMTATQIAIIQSPARPQILDRTNRTRDRQKSSTLMTVKLVGEAFTACKRFSGRYGKQIGAW